jgi:hypothetical protein
VTKNSYLVLVNMFLLHKQVKDLNTQHFWNTHQHFNWLVYAQTGKKKNCVNMGPWMLHIFSYDPLYIWRGQKMQCKPNHRKVLICTLLIPALQITAMTITNCRKWSWWCHYATQFTASLTKNWKHSLKLMFVTSKLTSIFYPLLLFHHIISWCSIHNIFKVSP